MYKELIQKNKSEFYDKFIGLYDSDMSGMGDDQKEEVFNWHTQSLKDLIDAVIEDEMRVKKEIFESSLRTFGRFYQYYDSDEIGWDKAKQDTINKLKAIREML